MLVDAGHNVANGAGEVCVVLEDERTGDPAACNVGPEFGVRAPAAELGGANGVFWGVADVVGFGFVGDGGTVDLRRRC